MKETVGLQRVLNVSWRWRGTHFLHCCTLVQPSLHKNLHFFVEDSAKALQHITNAHFLGANATYLRILLCKRCYTQYSDLVAQIVNWMLPHVHFLHWGKLSGHLPHKDLHFSALWHQEPKIPASQTHCAFWTIWRRHCRKKAVCAQWPQSTSAEWPQPINAWGSVLRPCPLKSFCVHVFCTDGAKTLEDLSNTHYIPTKV